MNDPIFAAVLAEVERAEAIHGSLPMGEPSEALQTEFANIEACARADLDLLPPSGLAILAEEVGELGRAKTPDEQRSEAIQCMVVLYRFVRNLGVK